MHSRAAHMTQQTIRQRYKAICDLGQRIRGLSLWDFTGTGGRYLSQEAGCHHPTVVSPWLVTGASPTSRHDGAPSGSPVTLAEMLSINIRTAIRRWPGWNCGKFNLYIVMR